MEPRAPQRKVNEAVALYEAALLYISLSVAARTTASGSALSESALTASGGVFINLVVTSALAGYRAAQALAGAFGRLMQAVWTGTTTATDDLPTGSTTSVSQLYQEFEGLALSFIPEDRRDEVFRLIDDTPDDETVDLSSLYPQRQEDREDEADRYTDDSDLLDLEADLHDEDEPDAFSDDDIEGWPDDEDIEAEEQEEYDRFLEDLERARADEEKRLREALRKEMRDNLRVKIKIARRRKSEKIAKKRLERALAEARTKAAGEASKSALAGARDHATLRGARGDRVYGWARVPGSAKPCHFCLALISLGAFYSTEESASAMTSGPNKGDEFHEHCHCEIVQVYSWEQYIADPVFKFNRAMYKLWGELSGGQHGGLEEWRKSFEEMYEDKDLEEIVRDNHKRHS